MITNPDDPNLTAYALGELSPEESAEIEKAIANSVKARGAVEKTRELAALLRDEFRAELRETRPRNIMPLPMERSFWSDARWSSLAVAAGVAIFAIIGLVLFFQNRAINLRVTEMGLGKPSISSPTDIQMEVEMENDVSPPHDNLARDAAGENVFVSAAVNPISRFRVNFATAAYPAVRAFLESGSLPPKEAVRVEELVNSFRYDYSAARENEPFSIDLEASACPWQPGHRLLRIGLRGNASGKNRTSLGEINAGVEFNTARVASYRLIGYDSVVSRKEFSSDGTNSPEVSANQGATILYEIVPTTIELSATAELEMLTVKLRSGNGEEMTRVMKEDGAAFESASRDFRFAAAVAEFAMLLRKSPYRGSATFGDVLQWAERARGDDADGARAEFVRLARRAQSLTSG